MQRINTMHVIPDLIPDLHPSVDLYLAFRHPNENPVHNVGDVEAGLYLKPEQVRLRSSKFDYEFC